MSKSSFCRHIEKIETLISKLLYSTFVSVLGSHPQHSFSTASNLVTQSGLVFANGGIRKTANLGGNVTKTSLQATELTFDKHLASAVPAAVESFSSGSNRTPAISGKRSSDFDTASLASGNSNSQPETATAMLLVQSQQVSTPIKFLSELKVVKINPITIFEYNPKKISSQIFEKCNYSMSIHCNVI